MKTLFACALLVLVAVLGLALSTSHAAGDNPVVVMKTSMGDIEIELFPDAAPETVQNFVGLAEGTKEFTDSKTGQKVKRPFYDGLVFHRCIANFMIQGGCPLSSGMGDPGFKFKDEINAKGLGLDKEKLFDANKQPHPWIAALLPRNPQQAQMQFQQMVILPLLKSMGLDPIRDREEVVKREKELNEKLFSLTLQQVYENQGYVYDDKLTAYHPKRGVIAMANSGPNTNGSQFFINVVDTPHLTGKHTVFGKVVKGMDVVDKIVATPVGAGAKPTTPITIVSVRLKK